jgi:hypothetical protein
MQLCETYAATGYGVITNAFGLDRLRDVAETLGAALMKSDNAITRESLDDLILARDAEEHRLVYNASQSLGSSAATYNLLGSSGILDTVCGLADFDLAKLHILPMYLIVQLPGNEKFDYGWHQDGAYYDWCEEMATVWFPVNRAVTRESGTISVIPGSHTQGRRPADTHFRDGLFRQIDAKLGDQEAQSGLPLELEMGDCCIMNGNLVHRSVANRSSTPRIAGVVRLAHLAKADLYDRDRFYCAHKS